MSTTGKLMLSALRTSAPWRVRTGLLFFLAAGPYVPASLAAIEMTKLTAVDGAALDEFGTSVSISGDTMVVGAFRDDGGRGSAYVFVRSGGTWTQQAKLTASDGAVEDYFGFSVSVSGDTVVVGASGDDVESFGINWGQGSAYVFVKPAGGWADMTETAKLTASDGAVDDSLGISVAVSGDTVVAGAYLDELGVNTAQGSAYVFVKPAGGWSNMTETAKLTASDGAGYELFGRSVASSGDTVVVSALQDQIGPNLWQGSAYVFVKPGGGWADMTQTAKLTASDGAEGDQLGESVALSGDAVVVGAHYDDIGPNPLQGSAYVFVKPAGGWADMTQTGKLTSIDGTNSNRFGASVAVSGDTVVVGAFLHGMGGSAFLFVRPGGGWSDMTQTASLKAADGGYGDQFGKSVALSGDALIVGAGSDDFGINVDQGSTYVYDPTIGPVEPPLAAPAPHDRSKNRYVSFVPNNPGAFGVAYRVSGSPGVLPVITDLGWVGTPDAQGLSRVVADPHFRTWSEPVIHVGDCEIIPVALYEIRATLDGVTFTAPLTVGTIAEPVLNGKKWGDVSGQFTGSWPAPDLFTNVNDLLAVLAYINSTPTKPHITVVNIADSSAGSPCVPPQVNVGDVQSMVAAIASKSYGPPDFPLRPIDPALCPPCP